MARTLQLEHLIKTDPEKAKLIFEDFHQFSALHPLFVGLEQKDENHFIVEERMPVSTIKFKYKTTVIKNKERNEVIYIAYPFFLTLTITFIFLPGESAETCKMIETIEVKGPRIISDVLVSLIKKTHPQLIAKLNSKF
jgi:hypothetical protein